MKTIALHILKGGVGKTALATNIAYLLGKKNRTLLIDCDIQANASSLFMGGLVNGTLKHELADVLNGYVNVEVATKRIVNNLYMLPTKGAGSQLKLYSGTNLQQTLQTNPYVFKDLLDSLAGYDYVIFDMSPSISQLEASVLLAVDEVITPITPDYFSYNGIKLFSDELDGIRENYRVNPHHTKIILNNINKGYNAHKNYVETLKSIDDYTVFNVSQDRSVADSQLHSLALELYNPNSRALKDIQEVVNAI